ncbi:MAG: ribosome small subunit-dependent GTPase A [Calditrichaeota bacterium]|nr:MAG: ribosome small subunit-dependent GTPase A [Calditrichota bacterium]
MDERRTGKVLKVTRKVYDVMVDGRPVKCVVRGRLSSADSEYRTVRVGDDVQVRLTGPGEGVIEAILPRRSRLSRVVESRAYQEHIVATNIDQILIIMSAKNPPFKSGLLDRYLVIAEKNELAAVICVNKIDLANPADFGHYETYYRRIGYPFFYTSATEGTGLEQLKAVLQGKVTALVGHSGVGKSSLIKALEPGLDIKVGQVNPKTRKGQHTTTSVQLFPLSFGGYVIDTPGVRELGLWNIFKKDLKQYFVEFRELEGACQFGDCLHVSEPGCAVRAAVEAGQILPERYKNYLAILNSLRSAPYERI